MSGSEFVFEVTCDGEWPAMEDVGLRRLSVFFPKGTDCKELNYGQGEGQALIDGHEWGFYYNDRGNLHVVLHNADLSREQAQLVVAKICGQLTDTFGVGFTYSERR